jgi:uncharacterized protein (TIGR00255 family)
MIRSMTGFASIGREEGGHRVSVTVKSVNHRFLDIAIKAPQSLAAFESRARAAVQRRLTRGRIELLIALELGGETGHEVVLDQALLRRINQAVGLARDKGLVSGGLTPSDMLRIPQVLDIRPTNEGVSGLPESAAALVERVLGDALDALVGMRETEGRFLGADLEARLATLAGLVTDIEREAKDGQARLDARLRERLLALPADLVADQAAVAQEVVRFVARSDVDEELTRLRGHFAHWRALADGAEPCGRKLDFLVQEMNREINTTGAKAEGPRVTELVIGAKAELERVREQVQNVE